MWASVCGWVVTTVTSSEKSFGTIDSGSATGGLTEQAGKSITNIIRIRHLIPPRIAILRQCW